MRLNRFLSARAATLVFAASLVSSVAAQGPATSATAANVDISRVRIDNFGRINESYYRGGQPEGRDYADLAALGVKTVIDLQADFDKSEEAMVQQAGMRFLRIPMSTRVAPTEAQIDQFLQLVNDASAQPVYVHCKGGRHRTGVMTAVYRMTQHNWTADQAFKEMKAFDFGWDFLHPEFKKFVYAYPQQLQRAANRAPALMN